VSTVVNQQNNPLLKKITDSVQHAMSVIRGLFVSAFAPLQMHYKKNIQTPNFIQRFSDHANACPVNSVGQQLFDFIVLKLAQATRRYFTVSVVKRVALSAARLFLRRYRNAVSYAVLMDQKFVRREVSATVILNSCQSKKYFSDAQHKLDLAPYQRFKKPSTRQIKQFRGVVRNYLPKFFKYTRKTKQRSAYRESQQKQHYVKAVSELQRVPTGIKFLNVSTNKLRNFRCSESGKNVFNSAQFSYSAYAPVSLQKTNNFAPFYVQRLFKPLSLYCFRIRRWRAKNYLK
jgi:hypothetical protein